MAAERPTKEKKPVGRPSSYTEAVAATICELLSEGVTLREICRQPGMPTWQTVYRWKAERDEFSNRIAHARDLGFDAIAEEALHIADHTEVGIRVKVTADGTETVTEDMLGHRKLQVETRLKLLSKWAPKKYGEKVDVNHGGQADNPLVLLQQQISGTAFKPRED